MKMSGPIATVDDPTTVQATPSGEIDPISEFPIRSSLTQYGIGTVAGVPASCVDAAPALPRWTKTVPFPPVTNIPANGDPAVSVSRIMTPCFAPAVVVPGVIN